MLEELHVHNYAIIDKLQVRFTSGLNILSGETGAGKSILVGALGLLLGDKTDTSIIRSGAEETTVSGIVSVPGNAEAAQWLAAHGIEPEEGAVILRRMLKSNGRGSLFIQSTPVTRADLHEFSTLLFDLHGQHEHQSLLDLENHRKLVDRWSGGDPDRAGRAYAVNVLGCIVGPLVAGFVLLPLFGEQVSLLILVLPWFVMAIAGVRQWKFAWQTAATA
ncbi:MAG: AAA family ATPase, partial [Spirochaetia bacterium]